ncbi:hypothetical protein [Arsukibacterium sp.]|uniref:hypothetical protein n=1 Tax=Arsukibacterium sp. TaxID=1977258 RepID=UPI0035647D56
MSVGTVVTSLLNQPEHPLLSEILQHTDVEQATEYRHAFATVTQLLKSVMLDDTEKTAFESNNLKRVIKGFSDEVTEQGRQRQILEAILRYAVKTFHMKAAKIPQLITLNRDTPALTPTMLVHTRAAMTLYNTIKADLEYPEKLKSVQHEVGRLAALLFLFEGIPDLASAALVLRNYQLHYAGSVIYLTDPEDSTGQKRFVIQLYTALLIQLVKRYDNIDYILERASRSSKMTVSYIQKYLRAITKQETFRISVTQLSNYRYIYWTSHYSPVEAKFLLQRFKSALLPTDIFIRTTLNKCQNWRETELSAKVDPTIEKTQKALQEHKIRHGSEYQQVKPTVKLIQQLIAKVKMQAEPSDKPDLQDALALSQNKKKPHQAAITRIVKTLEKPGFSQNFYVLLFGNYLINLLKNGGSRKSLLAFRTIRDYVSAPLKAFITTFADLDLLKMDEETLTDKLNSVAKLMAPTKRGCLYYLADYIQQLDLVTDFMAANLDIRAESGKVHANIVSVPQMEELLEFINDAGEQYTDAILLLCLGFYSGARRSEAKLIRVSDFELLPTANGIEVSVKIVPTKARTIKSPAGTRTINLNVFWPKKWLALLVQKLQLARAAGISKTDCLFDITAEQHLTVISQLLRTYLCDKGFKFHSLRHSFVCWQYYRLVLQPRLKGVRAENVHCLKHDYFADEACSLVRKQLGLPAVSRKAVYALCALVGHSDPIITFDSYLHLRDLYCYLLISSKLCLKQKALSQLVSRAKLDSKLLQQFPASAISYSTLSDEYTLDILPAPWLAECKTLSVQHLQLKQSIILPCLSQLEHGLRMLGKIQPDEVTRVEDDGVVVDIEGAWLNTLWTVCGEVRQQYPERSKRLRLIPEIARSKGQLQAGKKVSNTRLIFEELQTNAQVLIDEQQWSDTKIVDALEALKGLLILQDWTIQFKDPARLGTFLQLCRAILPENIKPKVTIHDPEIDGIADGSDNLFERWIMTLAMYDITPEIDTFEAVEKPGYWTKQLDRGVVWFYFVEITEEEYTDSNGQTQLRQHTQRASSVMKFLHFLLVACITRHQLSL